MLTPEQAASRAQAGAQYLDDTQPGWPLRINLDALDISSKCRCVRGQLHGHYESAPELFPAQREDYGFEIVGESYGELIPQYRLLTSAWRELITARMSV